MNYSLLICEVPHGKADAVSKAAVEAGSFGGSVCMGRKIAPGFLASAFGLGGSTVDVLYIVVEKENKTAICSAIKNECETEKTNFGCLYSMAVDTLIKNGNSFEGEKEMTENTHELISVISPLNQLLKFEVLV